MADAPDIIVQGYSDRYKKAVAEVLVREGGFANVRNDRGGATNFGISLRFLKAEGKIDLDGDGFHDFDLNFDGDLDGRDIRGLTRGDAIWLYHEYFWERLQADDFARPVGEMMFDQAVNGGLSAAKKMLQSALNTCLSTMPRADLKLRLLTVDGALGAATHDAMDAVIRWQAIGMPGLIAAYRATVAARYRAIVARDPSQAKFLNGWLNRARLLGAN